jgi:hypothetical protein
MPLVIPVFFIGVAAVIFGVWFVIRCSWHRRSRDELVHMVQVGSWRYLSSAITELRRRGDDVSIYAPSIIAKLVSESKIERAYAHIHLVDLYPDLASEIEDFSPTDTVEICRAKAAPLLARYGVSHVA